MRSKYLVSFAAGIGCGLFAVALVFIPTMLAAHAQETDPTYPQTRMWNVADNINGNDVKLTIVETAGVCLYAAYHYDVKGDAVTLAAIPKTQLPKGAGCQ